MLERQWNGMGDIGMVGQSHMDIGMGDIGMVLVERDGDMEIFIMLFWHQCLAHVMLKPKATF